MTPRWRIAVLAGEPSGDRLGAALVRALRREADAELFGVGGPAMRAAGVESPFPITDLSVMGLFEVLPRAGRILRRMREVVRLLAERRPDAVVTIDSPDFMQRVVRRARAVLTDTRFVNYVAPTVWAWRPGRAREIARLYDLQLTLLPFEPPWFERAGGRAAFVGHPVVEQAACLLPRAKARAALALDDRRPTLLLLPGSRRGEIRRLGPVFRAVAARVGERHPNLAVVLPVAHGVESDAAALAAAIGGNVRVLAAPSDEDREADKWRAMRAADVALAASGSVALELAVAGLPAVIAYRLSPATWAIGRMLTRHRTASLVNLLAEATVQPEFIQSRCRPRLVAAELLGMLADEGRMRRRRHAAEGAVGRLSAGDMPPSRAAALQVLRVLAAGQCPAGQGPVAFSRLHSS